MVVPRQPARREARLALLALALLVPAPSLGIASEMIWFEGAVGLSILAATKLWILLLPLAWILWVERRPLRPPALSSQGVGPGLALGLVGGVTVVVAYEFVLRERIDPAQVDRKSVV